MGRKIIIFLLALIQFVLSSEIPFLRQNEDKNWKLDQTALDKLNEFKERELHVIAIGGPTRMGKSFIMSNLIPKFEKLHFGDFFHQDNMNSVTMGMNIALVEHVGKLILLIDCEGLDSLSKKMDPKLMIMMSMISQKMMYLTQDSITTKLLEHISTMLVNRDQTDLTQSDLPLDTMFTVINKTQLEKNWRDPFFLRKALKKDPHILDLFNKAYPNKKVLFVTEADDLENLKEEEQFNEDIEELFQHLIENLPSFSVQGNILKVKDYISYVQNRVLDNVNDNVKIVIKTRTDATYENFARKVINELKKDLPQCEEFYEDNILKKIINFMEYKKIEFQEQTKHLPKSCIENVKNEFEKELNEKIEEFKAKNERLGNLIVDFDVKFEYVPTQCTENLDDLEITKQKNQCYQITITTYANGKTDKKSERMEGYDSENILDVKEKQNILKELFKKVAPILIEYGSKFVTNKIMEKFSQPEALGQQQRRGFQTLELNLPEDIDLDYSDDNNGPKIQNLCFTENDLDTKDADLDFSDFNNAPKIQTVAFTGNNPGYNDESNSNIKNKVKQLENDQKLGLDKNSGKWFPHKSPEGGFDTIGYGHKIQSKEEQERLTKFGLSNDAVNKMFDKDWNNAKDKAAKTLKNFDSASKIQQDIATELQFNVGNIKGYKKFQDAFEKKDTNRLLQENNRGYHQNGKFHQLKTRQNELKKAAESDMKNKML